MTGIPQESINQLQLKGYLDIEVDPTLDLVSEINKLKKEKNAVILAHYCLLYTSPSPRDRTRSRMPSSA